MRSTNKVTRLYGGCCISYEAAWDSSWSRRWMKLWWGRDDGNELIAGACARHSWAGLSVAVSSRLQFFPLHPLQLSLLYTRTGATYPPSLVTQSLPSSSLLSLLFVHHGAWCLFAGESPSLSHPTWTFPRHGSIVMMRQPPSDEVPMLTPMVADQAQGPAQAHHRAPPHGPAAR